MLKAHISFTIYSFVIFRVQKSKILKIVKKSFLHFLRREFIEMKDILEKEIQISDLYPPTNVVRTDFTALFAGLATRSEF